MLHKCIKPSCGKSYNDEDPDPYYCPRCVEEKKLIAQQIDATHSTVGREVVSDLQAFDAEARTFTTQDGRQVSFMKLK